MSALRVAAGEGAEPVTAAVLSSLPISFAPAADLQAAEVVVVAGVAGWPTRVQQIVEGGAAAIVVQPEPADVAPLLSSVGRVAIDSTWAGNPATMLAAEHFATAAAYGGTLLECQVIIGDVRSAGAALLDVAALIRSLLAPLRELRVLRHDRRGFVASGVAGGVGVTLSVHRSTAVPAQARVRLLTPSGGVEVTLPDSETARPAEIVITTPQDQQLLPTLWESPHRATWRRLSDTLAAGTPSADLSEFHADQCALAHPLSLLNQS